MTSHDIFWALAYLLAAARVTHLITTDTILEPARIWLLNHGTHWVDDLIHCPYCIGFWVSLLSAAVYLAFRNPVFDLFSLAFAFSYAVARLEISAPTAADDD